MFLSRLKHVRKAEIASLLLIGLLCRTSAAQTAITEFSAKREAGTLHVEAQASDPALWANTQLLIDLDGDAKTGYQGAGADHGYDVMVEGSTIYRFKGSDPTAWAWDQAGSASRKTDGGKLALDIDLAPFKGKSSSAVVLLRALSTNYQTVLATAPASGPAIVNLDGKDAVKAKPLFATSAPVINQLTASATQDGSDLVVNVTAATAADLNTILIFFDTDENAATGFNPPADPRFGFEMMIQGGSLSKHTGETRDGWSWLTLSAVKETVTGNSAQIRFNASLLKSKKCRMAVWQMSADWQLRNESFPHNESGEAGTMEIKLDASKLHADASVIDVPMAAAHADASLPARERFKRAQTYSCYYGPDRAAALSHVDAAILHIPAQTPEDVSKLNKLGVITIGYLSVGEDESLRVGNGQGPGGKASWYFDRNHVGKPEQNGIWSSYFANAADTAWRDDRVAQAKHLCGNNAGDYGFDGIFLDTIETVDAYPESRAGMIQLVGQLRAALPDKVIVMNRGFSLLKEADVSSKIDGLMFEDFTDSYDFASKQYLRLNPGDLDFTRGMMISSVQPAVKQYGFRVFALDYCAPDQKATIAEAADRAVTFGMVPGVAPITLDAVYDTWDLTPHADPKYLEKMATPEKLQIKLDTARNGFPTGTIVQPSSCYMGYSVAAIVDGVQDRSSMDWSKRAWASTEDPNTPQQLLFDMPTPTMGGTLKITFATDGGRAHPSRNFEVAARADDQSPWEVIASPHDQADTTCSFPLPPHPIRQIRIVQSAGGGSVDRADLMWVAQVERTD